MVSPSRGLPLYAAGGTGPWIVSTETDPKARGESPPGTSSWFLHQLARFILNQLKASLKHLTFKTVFLLALGSGKRRSEIHAWQNRNIRPQSDWSKVPLYPSPSFLSKNQLAKEGPDSLSPGVITALAPTLDRSLKSDTFTHNTFTQFYMTGGAWADSELYQLGSVVAAQQIHKWPLD